MRISVCLSVVLPVLDDEFRRPFANHDDWRIRVPANNLGHGGPVRHPQILYTLHLKKLKGRISSVYLLEIRELAPKG